MVPPKDAAPVLKVIEVNIVTIPASIPTVPAESADRIELTRGMTKTYRDVWKDNPVVHECPEWLMRSLRTVIASQREC